LSYYLPTAYEQYRLPPESTGSSGVDHRWDVSLILIVPMLLKKYWVMIHHSNNGALTHE
jgi:hypothetical protein